MPKFPDTFQEWTLENAEEAIQDAIELAVGKEGFKANKSFVEERDHWQDGAGWMGPDGGDPATRAEVLKGVERQFTPRDTINEVLGRMANALLRRRVDLDLIPLEPLEEADVPEEASQEERDRLTKAAEEREAELEREIGEIQVVLMEWMRDRKFWRRVRSAVKRSRWAARGALRAWIAPANLSRERSDEGERTRLPTGLAFEHALSLVEIDAPEPDAVLVYRDPRTSSPAALFLFTEDDAPRAELWYLDGEDTVLRILGGNDDGREFRIPLGGRLPINEMAGELLITEPVRRQQNRLNFFESLVVRVGETAGFPERYTLNAEPNGIWLTTAPTMGPALMQQIDDRGTTWYLHAAQRTLGSAITTDLVGIIDKGGEAGDRRQTPGVEFKDPTDPEYATKVAAHAYAAILNECKQGHIALERSGEASGVAYEQARADFDSDLADVKEALEELVRDTLEVAVVMAEQMSSDVDVLGRFRIAVTLHVTSGKVTPAEQEQNNANVKAGTLSAESAMARNGIEDVDAEVEKIRSSPESLTQLRTKQIEMVRALYGDGSEGMTWERAARIAGIDDKGLLRSFREADGAASEASDQESAQDEEITELLAGTAAGAAS